MDGLTTGMAFLAGLGLPEVLLWVLSFAVVYGVLTKIGVFKTKAPAALVSIIVGFMILLAVPASVVSIIATMSTGLIVAAIGFLVVLALIEVGNVKGHIMGKDAKGNEGPVPVHPFTQHGTIMTILVIGVTALIFWMSGGAALIGLGSLPAIGAGTWLLIVVGLAVLWMFSEKEA
jgi:hypothetical protein